MTLSASLDPWQDDDRLVWVDHREEEDALLRAFVERLAPTQPLEPYWQDDALWLRWRGQAHRIPLTFSPVDRYVAIHSLAELLAPEYRILVQRDSLESDTHGFWLAPAQELAALDGPARARLDAQFAPLQPGIDEFSGLEVPYLGHEERNPEVAQQRQEQLAQADAFVKDLMHSPEMQANLAQMRQDIAALARPSRKQRWLRALLWGAAIFIALRLLRRALGG
jgi:hypothetical protein